MTNVIQNVYPKDLTMSLASNYIEGEVKAFSKAEDRIFVPDGGAGGAIGEDGQPGTTKLYYATTNAANNSTFDFTNPALCTWLTPNAAGGKAGFIKTGNITIINKPGGITKGR